VSAGENPAGGNPKKKGEEEFRCVNPEGEGQRGRGRSEKGLVLGRICPPWKWEGNETVHMAENGKKQTQLLQGGERSRLRRHRSMDLCPRFRPNRTQWRRKNEQRTGERSTRQGGEHPVSRRVSAPSYNSAESALPLQRGGGGEENVGAHSNVAKAAAENQLLETKEMRQTPRKEAPI